MTNPEDTPHRYRICSVCSRTWNVSRIGKSPKKYICPVCANKKRPHRSGHSDRGKMNLTALSIRGDERKVKMKSIVSVCFRRKDSEEFGGKAYSYFTELPLSVGDIVKVPTAQGESVAKVHETDIHESKVDERILPLLKTITEYAEESGKLE